MSEDQDTSFIQRFTLDLRGTRFDIEREALMNLPESILLCLFPNGLVLRGNMDQVTDGEERDDDSSAEGSQEGEDQVIYVDFDPQCLDFVLRFFKKAQDDFYGDNLPSPISTSATFIGNNPLANKQAIIVLREELDFYTLPPRTPNAPKPNTPITLTTKEQLDIKKECGNYILKQRKIFTALQRNVNQENNAAEQHLIDMLCVSGFDRQDEWGYRNIEPHKCTIASIALVLLKTTGQGSQMATAQKLLLFWRKPARKCWWDGIDIVLSGERNVRTWARRVWTLELSLV